MKFTAQKIAECAEWVRLNGLYPQPCGAPVKQFCAAMAINDATFRRWMDKADFADAIKKAQHSFSQETVIEVVNALKRRALGYEVKETSREGVAQVVTEYDKHGRKVKSYTTDKIVTKKMTEKTFLVHPDTGAIIFMLTNMDPENWKNRRDGKESISIDFEEPPVIMFGEPSPEE